MKDLINFFFSFDKLMKHKLVPLFYWASLIYLGIFFIRRFFQAILEPIAWALTPLEFLSGIAIALIGLRLACELAIATFRIADNTSKDGGASDLADIDPLEETRRAAEEAAKRAREVTGKAVDKTKSAASNLKDSAEKRFDKAAEPSPKKKVKSEPVDQVFDKPVKTEDAPEPQTPKAKPVAKTTTAKKTASKATSTKTATKSTSKATSTTKKKTTAKKPAAKKTTAKKSTTKKS